MFKWQFAVVMAAGLALTSSGSPVVAGTQDQSQPVSKKPAMKKDQEQAQQKASPKQQKVSPKGQAKGQKQSQEQASVKPTQPSGKGKAKVNGGLRKKPNHLRHKHQPQVTAQPQ